MKVLGLVRKSSILILVLGILAPSSQAATTPDEQFVGQPPSDVRSVPYFGFSANGLGPFTINFNYLFGKVAEGTVWNESPIQEVGLCKKISDLLCTRATYVSYFATLGFCKNLEALDCIESFSVTDSSGKLVPVTERSSFPGDRVGDFEGKPSIGLPGGGAAPLLSIPGLPHSGGDKYLVVVTAEGNRMPGKEKFSPPNIEASIYAVGIEAGYIDPPGFFTEKSRYPKLDASINTYGNPDKAYCAIYGITGCAKKYPLPLNAQFKLKVKLSNPTTGWLHGRIIDVNAEVTSTKAAEQTIEVIGKPLTLPTVYSWVKKSAAPDSITKFYDSAPKPLGGSGYGCIDRPGDATYACNPDLYLSVFRAASPDSLSMQEFLSWLPHLSDRATTAPSIWRFETMKSDGSEQSCYDNSKTLSGFVATNATQYLAGPPVFNKQEQTLDYKVAAPHYLPNGNEFLGTYDLQIRSEVARCLYGFTDAPISASISVTSADGKEKVATTELVQKDGWLNFSAKGFTFSNPTIRVKLTQKVETPQPQIQNNQGSTSVSTEQAAATPKPASIKMTKSITCIKGVKTRKVVGTNPKCPAGYKKRG